MGRMQVKEFDTGCGREYLDPEGMEWGIENA